jgi:hypothetical protein
LVQNPLVPGLPTLRGKPSVISWPAKAYLHY